MYQQPKQGIDGFSLVAILFVGFIILSFFVNSGEGSSDPPQQQPEQNIGGQQPPTPTPPPTRPNLNLTGDQTILAAPYEEYILTQGTHGASYGHAAIDIAGGKGATIYSPINGVVTGNYTDQYGNTTLILDNANYTVTFLHGVFTVNPGDKLTVGDIIGTESNIGYTMDMAGRLCTNRDCGYHSHLNVFDKTLGRNINPLDYFDLQPATELKRFIQ